MMRAGFVSLVVPLLAVPQATHYVLDALLWRTAPAANPGLAERIGLADGPPGAPTPIPANGTPFA